MKDNKGTVQQGKVSTKGTTGVKGGVTAGSKSNSITFGKTEYVTADHLLRTQFTQGGNSIIVSINENVLTELYDCTPTEQDLKASFTEHQPEISRALLAKIANKQWKVPNKEIVLSIQDLA